MLNVAQGTIHNITCTTNKTCDHIENFVAGELEIRRESEYRSAGIIITIKHLKRM